MCRHNGKVILMFPDGAREFAGGWEHRLSHSDIDRPELGTEILDRGCCCFFPASDFPTSLMSSSVTDEDEIA